MTSPPTSGHELKAPQAKEQQACLMQRGDKPSSKLPRDRSPSKTSACHSVAERQAPHRVSSLPAAGNECRSRSQSRSRSRKVTPLRDLLESPHVPPLRLPLPRPH